MTTTTELIDAYAARHGLENDLQIAKRLKLASGSVYRYRRGPTMDDALAIQICRDLRIDPAPILANLAADREIKPNVKAEWRRIAKTLGASAVGLTAVLINLADAKLNAVYNYVCILCQIKKSLIRRYSEA